MKLIVNADDFGLSSEINRAVLKAHREGVLTSASLIAGAKAFDEAVAIARENPRLAVGLHVVAVDGPAVLPRSRIPRLVNEHGMFPNDPVGLGMRYVLSAAAREELAAELRAQFERFAATGLKLSHVDGHQHMHMHPVVFGMILPLARRFGAAGFRVPRDELSIALRLDRRKAARKMGWTLIFGLLSRYCQGRVCAGGFAMVDRTYGFMQTGQMHSAYVGAVLRQMRSKCAEMYFHPRIGARDDYFGANPDDLESLLSRNVRQIIEQRGIELTSYVECSATAARKIGC